MGNRSSQRTETTTVLVISAIMIGIYLLILDSHALLELGLHAFDVATSALEAHGICFAKACGV